MMRTKLYACLAVAALLLATAGSAAAQEFRATVRGQVLDSSKAALPGATVIVDEHETGEVATATTNTEGNYTIPFLRPGLVHADRGAAGLPEAHAHGMRCRSTRRRRSTSRSPSAA